MVLNHERFAKYISLIAMTIFTVVSIINNETTVFYIIYLFWCDEFLRTIFDRIKLRFINCENESLNQIKNLLRNKIKSRFFMLFVYWVFIFVIFGLVMNWENSDLVLLNFEVLFFRNPLFNASLIAFLLREIFLFCKNANNSISELIMPNGIIILHLSIIIGILFWFLFTQKFLVFEQYAIVFSIVPFLILKLIFELNEEI